LIAQAEARWRILAMAILVGFAIIALRVITLPLLVDARASERRDIDAPAFTRADLVDRNDVLLATTIPGYNLAADPRLVFEPEKAARELKRILPDLDQAQVARKLADRSRKFVIVANKITQRQKQAILAVGVAGLMFEDAPRRAYPNGVLAAHALGFVNRGFAGVAGVERGLDGVIRKAGQSGAHVRLSLDIRLQYALEQELGAAVARANAEGGAGVLLDGATGEVLALASAPQFDPNRPGAGDDPAKLNRASGAIYEMGSTIKPFTLAMAMQDGLVRHDEPFTPSTPVNAGGVMLKDHDPKPGQITIRDALVHSSNTVMAELALRLGAEKQRAYLDELGLLRRLPIEMGESGQPFAPLRTTPEQVGRMGFGHGAMMSLLQMAGAYTVFVNAGERASPTMLAQVSGDPVRRTRVFDPIVAQEVLLMMRDVVMIGTGKTADIEGLEIAGKTGTAEIFDGRVYDPDRQVSSFIAVFPASAPRFVLALAVMEPARTQANGGQATAAATAAPAAGRVAARIAPFLGLGVEAAPAGGLTP
jgi:cell division protein FtsI (penicillin-binding protein 3)